MDVAQLRTRIKTIILLFIMLKNQLFVYSVFLGGDSVHHNKLDFSDKNSKDIQVAEEKQKFSQFLVVGWSLRMLESCIKNRLKSFI